jgi:hypothetical protein
MHARLTFAVRLLVAVQLFRAPYGDGFDPIGIATPPSAETKRNWKIVQKHHVHVGW